MKKTILISLFITFVFSLSGKTFYEKINFDLYLGLGKGIIQNTEFDKSIGRGKGYAAGRLGFKITPKVQIETGFTNTIFGSREYFEVDNSREFGRSYNVKYHQIPILLRSKIYKGLWFGAGAQYNIIANAKYYNESPYKSAINIKSTVVPNFWSAYTDLKLVYEEVAVGANYSWGLNAIDLPTNKWKASSFNVYISYDFNKLLKVIGYKYFNIR